MSGFSDDRGKSALPPGLSALWGLSGTNSEVFEEEEDPCVICHEEMTPATTVMLECKHRFHDEVRNNRAISGADSGFFEQGARVIFLFSERVIL
jgi:hypothetical protein